MFKNYFKIAFRNLSKSKIYTFINILGFSVAVCAVVYIALFIFNESKYDNFHKNGDDIYRVVGTYDRGEAEVDENALTTYLLGTVLKTNFPQVERVVRIDPNYKLVVRYNDKVYRQDGIMYADSGFFDMFTFPIVEGRQNETLNGINQAVISKELAEKFFGNNSPVGKKLEVNDQLTEIVAVINNMPVNSHFHSGLIISLRSIEDSYPRWVHKNWTGLSHYTYIQLKKNENPVLFEKNLNEMWDKNFTDLGSEFEFHLQPLKSIHLQSHLSNEIETNGNLSELYILALVGIILLIIAGINYMNMATARSIERTQEIGIRKVLGAERKQVVFQFLSESLFVAFTAVIIGFLMAEVFTPYLNSIVGKDYSIQLSNGIYWLGALILLAILIGLLSGSYPALLASTFRSFGQVKSTSHRSGVGSNLLRKTLIVTQFAAAIAILISTSVIYNQIDFMRTQKLGINPSEVVMVPFQSGDLQKKYETMKDKMLSNPNILDVSATNNNLPNRVLNWREYEIEGRDKSITIPTMVIDYDFFKTLGADFVQGRDYSKDYSTDKSEAYIINESAVKLLGLKNPIGTKIEGRVFTGSVWDNKYAKIIGVVKDFHTSSFHNEIQPAVFSLASEKTTPMHYMVVKLNAHNLPASVASLKSIWNEFTNKYPLEYSFLDEKIDKLYKSEDQFLSKFSLFAFMIIIISCMGALGLAAFTASQKRKEIGIRKVMGATSSKIVWLLSKDFVKLALIANLIAWPAAYFFMNKWLSDFAYRINLNLAEFIEMAALVFVIILFTVGYQAYKASIVNPIQSLRNE